MTGITKQWVSGRYRLYRTFSWRDSANYPKNHKKLIATFDPDTEMPVFNEYFMGLLNQQGINIDDIVNMDWKKIPSIVDFGTFDPLTKKIEFKNNVKENKDDQKNGLNLDATSNSITKKANNIIKDCLETQNIRIEISNDNIIELKSYEYSCKEYGSHILLMKILEDTGLKFVLKDVFPKKWKEIATLAYYLVCNNAALMYCENWVDDTVTYLDNNAMQSPRISELLHAITYDNTMSFYENWAKYVMDKDYLALDITSISSYSQLMNLVEPGHNRNDENLPQVNYCLLFGEKSSLPVISSTYPGSINDVVALTSFIGELEPINNFNYKLVMDNGFYSLNNIKMFLDKYPTYKFLISVPFTTSIAKKIVTDGITKFDKSRSFRIDNDIILAYSFIQKLNNKYNLIYHVYCNELLISRAYANKTNDILTLKDQAKVNFNVFKDLKDYKKHINFNKISDQVQYDITVNYNRIVNELKNIGWMIIVGNELDLTYQDAIAIYRNKDYVEKAFNRFKNLLDLKRLRTHTDKNSINKLFIGFVALVITSYINKIMSKNKLYSVYTLTELIQSLNKIKLLSQDNNSIITPISKKNKEILDLFGIKIS